MIEVILIVNRAKYPATVSARPSISIDETRQPDGSWKAGRWEWVPIGIKFTGETPDLKGVDQVDMEIGKEVWTIHKPVHKDDMLAYERVIRWEK